MEPVTKKRAGRELGNAAAAAAIAGIHWETYQWYVRTKRPEGNPAPRHVETDNETGQRMYPLKEVRAWHARRPGRGNWGGIGAHARKPVHRSSKPDQADGTTGDAAGDAAPAATVPAAASA